jgi:hypothetical protein
VIAACVLPRLASSCARAATPSGAAPGGPTVVVALASSSRQPSPQARVVDVDEAAAACGVVVGQRLLEAQRQAPALRVVVVDEGALWREVLSVAELLYRHGPACEPLAPTERTCLPYFAVLVDVRGVPVPPSRLLAELARTIVDAGHRPVVALSPSRALSLALAKDMAARPARWGRSTLYVAGVEDGGSTGWGTRRDALRARIGIDALEMDRDVVHDLRATGVVTARDLVPLLSSGLVERLGTAARRVLPVLIDAADAADIDDVVTAWRPAEIVVASRELEHAVATLSPLLFLLRPLVEDVLRRVRAREQRVLELTLVLQSRGIPEIPLAVAFPAAVDEITVVLRVLQARLERAFGAGLALGEGIRAVHLSASRTTTALPRQLETPGSSSSTTSSLASGDPFGALLAEFVAEYGAERVGHLQATSAARPERMTAWAAAAPANSEGRPLPRRRPRPAVVDPRTAGGRFSVGWSWPLSVLPQPVPLAADEVIVERRLFARLDGEDGEGPWQRELHVVVFADGRRALGEWDDELAVLRLWGWFD